MSIEELSDKLALLERRVSELEERVRRIEEILDEIYVLLRSRI